MALDKRRDLFVEEYLVDLNATQAAIRAGYSEKTAYSQGQRLLKNVEVQKAIAEAQLKRSERTEITADMVLQRWWSVATADPNDLMSFRRAGCRCCWGRGFQYQWADEAEYGRACEKAIEAEGDMPLDDGGYGFKSTRPPHPDCPQCEGTGVGYAHFEDTRTVKGAARLLYAGVKTTKEGVELKVHDQAKALENVAKHLGMFVEKHVHSAPGGGPIEHAVSIRSLTDEEIEQRLAEIQRRGSAASSGASAPKEGA